MRRTRKQNRAPSAEAIARQAERGLDVSSHFTNRGTLQPASIQRVNVDFTQQFLGELDALARELNVSRQAIIKTYLRQGLDQRYRASADRQNAAR